MADGIYRIGRFFQLAGLLFMPSAIVVAELGYGERAAIAAFVGSLLLFGIGTGLTRASRAV